MRAKAIPTTPTINSKDAGRCSYAVAGHLVAAPKARPGLYLVAAPIGNLGDITLRALETLAGVDVIACEDTRITRRLTERYTIGVELMPYHEHNAEAARPKILQRLSEGASIALVSDAGTPLISDPGYKLVREACAAGHAVHALPGPSSVLAALSVAALPTDRFFFEGFMPAKSAARRARLAELARAGDARRVRPGDRPARRGCRGAGNGRARWSVARAAGRPQRQGCRGACGRALGPAAPRGLCPRARARKGFT